VVFQNKHLHIYLTAKLVLYPEKVQYRGTRIASHKTSSLLSPRVISQRDYGNIEQSQPAALLEELHRVWRDSFSGMAAYFILE
jgi:hypothetical protein